MFSHSRQLTEGFRRMGSSVSQLRFLPAGMNETRGIAPSWFTSMSGHFERVSSIPEVPQPLCVIQAEPLMVLSFVPCTAPHRPHTLPDPCSEWKPSRKMLHPQRPLAEFSLACLYFYTFNLGRGLYPDALPGSVTRRVSPALPAPHTQQLGELHLCPWLLQSRPLKSL